MAAPRASDVYGEPPKRIRPAIIINVAVCLFKAEFFAIALNLNPRLMLRSTTLCALPRYKRRPRLGSLTRVVANETVPAVEVDVQEQMALAAILAQGAYEEEEPAVDLSSARDDCAVPLVRLAGEQKLEVFTATRTTNCAGNW
jgi:hypothetical protein